MSTVTDPLAIWSQVEQTDPRYTKDFSRGGGFRGTAINATHLIRRATEIFGPCGIGWGYTVLTSQFIPGAPLDDRGTLEQIHCIHLRLWYLQGDSRDSGARGEIEHFGQTTFVGRNKNGFFTDEEAPKKSLTDALTKCLSMLGFAADVHGGRYDDNKYVSDLRQQFAQAPKPAPAESDRPVRDPAVLKALRRALDKAGLEEDKILAHFKVLSLADLSRAQYLKVLQRAAQAPPRESGDPRETYAP